MSKAVALPLDPDRIALRAYYLWEGEGRPDGRHQTHWLAAEAAEKRSEAARRAAATRRANQDAKPRAPKSVLVAATAARGAAASRAARSVH